MSDEPTIRLPVRRDPTVAGGSGRADRGTSGPVRSGPGGSAVPVSGAAADGPHGAPAPVTHGATGAPAPAGPAPAAVAGAAPRRRRWAGPVALALLLLALLAALGAAGYLYSTTTAYAERAAWTEDRAREIGAELVTTRGDLEGARGELEAVRAQLATAQERISALAEEKARIGDDREAQVQLLDYQARVSAAAGTVASALERCVQGQDQLIEYLGDAESYDPAQLEQFAADVERLCRSASQANLALQAELADR